MTAADDGAREALAREALVGRIIRRYYERGIRTNETGLRATALAAIDVLGPPADQPDTTQEVLDDDPETWPNEAIRVLNKAVERAYENGVRSGVADYRQSLRDAAQDQAEQARLCQRCSVDLDMLAPEWCSAPSGHRTADQPDTTACACPPCPGRGNDGHGMTHCAECCFGTGVIADLDCPIHGQPDTTAERQVAAVRALHPDRHWCTDRDGQLNVYGAGHDWPCPTLAALDAESRP